MNQTVVKKSQEEGLWEKVRASGMSRRKFLILAARLLGVKDFHTVAQHLYLYSILYIVVLFGAMIVDRLVFA